MKNKLIILSLIYATFATSCGSRKVNKSETKAKTEVTTEVKDTTSKVRETNRKEQVFSFTDELEITPIDTSKVVEVVDANGKVTKFKNAKIKRKTKEVKQTTDTQTKVAEKSLKTVKTDFKQDSKQNTKVVEKPESPAVNFWVNAWNCFKIILLLLLLVLIYIFLQKIR